MAPAPPRAAHLAPDAGVAVAHRLQFLHQFLDELQGLAGVEDVIDDQHIDHLVKVNEIVDGVVAAVILKMVDNIANKTVNHSGVYVSGNSGLAADNG